MQSIKLSNSSIFLIDEEDFHLIKNYKYFLSDGYVTRNSYKPNGNRLKVKLHNDIMNPPKGCQVDHINMNILDNRRVNLRICTHSQNMVNKKINPRNSTGYRGVSKERERYKAKITVNYRQIALGYFSTKEEAALAYNQAAIKYFGNFAQLNTI